MMTLAIVSPCYNEEPVLEIASERISARLRGLMEKGKVSEDSFVLYVNDGSRDNTWPIIERLSRENPLVRGISLGANVGHQSAIMAGMVTAKDRSDAVITIDADLQDDLCAIEEMVDAYARGCDIVYGVRRERKTDTWFKRNTALAFYRLMNAMGARSVYNHADYRLMSRRAVEFLEQYPERNVFLRGIVPLIGYKADCVYYNRAERFAGESKYPLGKMCSFAIDGITSFSIRPIYWVLWLGVAYIFVSLLIGVYVCASLFMGTAEHGWSSIMLSIWLVGGSILVALGIVGLYVGKTFMETKRRPRYNIVASANWK